LTYHLIGLHVKIITINKNFRLVNISMLGDII
jgi:hypothetical protein